MKRAADTMSLMGANPCAACGFAVFDRPAGSSDTCPVCGWVDDLLQLVQPDFTIGPNEGLSLRQAQRRAVGVIPASTTVCRGYSRHPRWRPLAAGEYPEGEPSSLSSPVCYLDTPDAEDFEPYWFRPRAENGSSS